MTQLRVRFAPSPTGELHVGGARTALFNWLLARKEQGAFILRIEDTDITRSSEAMSEQILKGMNWLGLHWDEGPHYQSKNRDAHVAYAEELLKAGKAYYDFSDPDELAAERRKLQSEGKPFRYDRRGREADLQQALKRIDGGEQAAVRFLVPEGRTSFEDLVHGNVSFENEKIDDFVILRNDGTPTYMLSVVADDVAMAITHVVRGDDHIANTPKQILLYTALGHKPPIFGHLPLILGPDRKKLSKRHGGNTMADYMEAGFLPQAVMNFLALLGWNPGDEREVMGEQELIDSFSFAGIGTSSAVFDAEKLEWINSQWIKRLSAEELLPHVRPELERLGIWDDALLGEKKEWFHRVLTLMADRSRRTWDLARDGAFFFRAPDTFDEKAVKKFCKGADVPQRVRALAEALSGSSGRLTAAEAEETLRSLAEKLEAGAGKLIHPMRIGMTGLGVTPDLFTIAELLGRDAVVRRLHAFAAYLEQQVNSEN